jgi:quercetin dioxygenase-like cupin family protein
MTIPSDEVPAVLTTPYQRGPAVGQSVWYSGALFTWLARAEDTGGAFALLDARTRKGMEPPPHTHTHEDEAVVVVDGDVTYRAGQKIMHVVAGQLVYLPRGFEHSFTVNSPDAHLLILMTPGGLETTFDEFSEPAPALTLPPAPAGPPPFADAQEMFARFTAAGVHIATSMH